MVKSISARVLLPMPVPWLVRPENAAATKFDFGKSDAFGLKGHIFLAEFGSGAPLTGDPNRNGYTVIRIDPATKEVQPFLSNKAQEAQGKEFMATAGPRHPVEAKFSPDGNTLYVVDIGAIGFTLAGAGPFPVPSPGTEVIWRITKDGTTSGPPANISSMPPKVFEK